jgi:hypothetical protein
MKKITFVVMAIFLSLTFYPTQSNAAATKNTAPTSLVVSNPAESAEAKALLKRIDEIDKMDKSNLKASEKRALRKEVRSIKKRLDAMGGYIYLSVGAALLIVLLIIILL